MRALTSPKSIEVHKDYVQVYKMHRVLFGAAYPREVDPGWLMNLVKMKADFNLSIHVHPYSQDISSKIISDQIIKLKSDVLSAQQAGRIPNQADVQQLTDLEGLLQLIVKNEEKLFDVGFYVDLKANDLKELDLLEKKVTQIMKQNFFVPKVPTYEMDLALQSALPFASDKMQNRVDRSMQSSSLAASFPFISSCFENKGGILLGFNMFNGIPITLSPFEGAQNPNMLILGSSGSGKTYLVKLLCARSMMEDTIVQIIDPQGEYGEMVKLLGGEVIRISPDSKSVINPFDLRFSTFDEVKKSVKTFLNIAADGNLSDYAKGIIDEVMNLMYDRRGIRPDDPSTWSKEPPTFEDMYRILNDMTRESEKKAAVSKASDNRAVSASALRTKISSFVTGDLRFFNQQTTVDLNKKIICYDISDVINRHPSDKGPILFLIFDYVYRWMVSERPDVRKTLVLDEAWSVFGVSDDYLTNIVKTSRKFNLSFVIITQDAGDLLKLDRGRPRGEPILANTYFKFLLRIDSTSIQDVVKYFNLHEGYRDFLLRGARGEALYMTPYIKLPVWIQAAEYEKDIIEAGAAPVVEQVSGRKPSVPVSLSEPVILKGILSQMQVTALQAKGYVEVADSGLTLNTRRIYMVKNETPEKNRHLIVASEIQNFVNNLASSKGFDVYRMKLKRHTEVIFPDLTFYTNKGEYVAVEVVEPEDLTNPTPNVRTKLENLKSGKEKFDKLFFVATTLDAYNQAIYKGFPSVLKIIDVMDTLKGLFE
ncbi:MAG: ATP-binding protein [Candidatus Altiarchaeota archaeon]|nr:ATP-binding protein [Candidatus Altiarchaeota archaeon]